MGLKNRSLASVWLFVAEWNRFLADMWYMKQLWFSAIHPGFPNTHFCHIFLLQENLFFMQDNLAVSF